MVWQRGGELLESPGWNLECADTGGGKTTEVKRCLVSSNQYRCYGEIDKSCRPIFFWNLSLFFLFFNENEVDFANYHTFIQSYSSINNIYTT